MASKANSEPENGFFQQVYAIVAQIPKGQALSYGQIAQMLGPSPGGADGGLGHAPLP